LPEIPGGRPRESVHNGLGHILDVHLDSPPRPDDAATSETHHQSSLTKPTATLETERSRTLHPRPKSASHIYRVKPPFTSSSASALVPGSLVVSEAAAAGGGSHSHSLRAATFSMAAAADTGTSTSTSTSISTGTGTGASTGTGTGTSTGTSTGTGAGTGAGTGTGTGSGTGASAGTELSIPVRYRVEYNRASVAAWQVLANDTKQRNLRITNRCEVPIASASVQFLRVRVKSMRTKCVH
jgi:hypothetical protein